MKLLMIVLFAMAAWAQDPADQAKKVLAEVGSRTIEQTFEYVGGQLLNGNPIKGAPYSADAVTEMTQTLPDGSHIVNRSASTLFRDSEGRERREESIARLGAWNAEGEPARAVFISDPVAKVTYSLDANAHTAQKMPLPVAGPMDAGKMTVRAFGGGEMPPPPAGRHQVMIYSERTVTTTGASSAKSPAKVEQLGTQTIEGVQAQGTRTTVTIPQARSEMSATLTSSRSAGFRPSSR